MLLDKFISETLTSIIKGINEAQDFAKDNNAFVNPDIQKWDLDKMITIGYKTRDGFSCVSKIDFDIAVTVSNTNESNLGGGINVYSLKLGADKSKADTNEIVSRIQFSVNVALPSTEI